MTNRTRFARNDNHVVAAMWLTQTDCIGKYRCFDIPRFYQSLEDAGYRWYGTFGLDELGRFAQRQYRDSSAGRRAYLPSYLQMKADGTIYALDAHAIAFLDSLTRERQRSDTPPDCKRALLSLATPLDGAVRDFANPMRHRSSTRVEVNGRCQCKHARSAGILLE